MLKRLSLEFNGKLYKLSDCLVPNNDVAFEIVLDKTNFVILQLKENWNVKRRRHSSVTEPMSSTSVDEEPMSCGLDNLDIQTSQSSISFEELCCNETLDLDNDQNSGGDHGDPPLDRDSSDGNSFHGYSPNRNSPGGGG